MVITFIKFLAKTIFQSDFSVRTKVESNWMNDHRRRIRFWNKNENWRSWIYTLGNRGEYVGLRGRDPYTFNPCHKDTNLLKMFDGYFWTRALWCWKQPLCHRALYNRIIGETLFVTSSRPHFRCFVQQCQKMFCLMI